MQAGDARENGPQAASRGAVLSYEQSDAGDDLTRRWAKGPANFQKLLTILVAG